MKTQNKMKTQNNLSAVELSDDLEDELRPEYDKTVLENGVRGKYLAQYRSGTNLILLDSDVAKFYPTTEAVNEALRRLIQLQEAA